MILKTGGKNNTGIEQYGDAMTGRANNKLVLRRLLPWLSLAVILMLTAMRCIHLGADPPQGLTRSGVLYTDEGWYLRNAVSRHLGGPWIVEGDFNPIVNMPVLQLVDYYIFKLLGMGLATARLPGVFSFALTILFLFLLLRRQLPKEIMLVALLLLTANYLLFSFSRVAIAENLMMLFIVSSLYFALDSGYSSGARNAALAALFFSFAVLTKTIAAFFLPVLVLLLWCGRRPVSLRPKENLLAKLGAAFAVMALIFLVYFIAFVSPHMEDFRYFNALNITGRLKPLGDESAMLKAFYVLKGSSLKQSGLSLIVYMGGIFSCIIIILSRRLRGEPLLLAMVLWVGVYMGIAAINGYAPPRYYLPVMIPLTVALTSVALWLPGAIRAKTLSLGVGVLVSFLLAASFVTNARKIILYAGASEYTFEKMSRSIGSIMRSAPDSARKPGQVPALMGHFANSISLEAGVQSYNDTFKTWSIERLTSRYEPSYYVCYGPVEKIPKDDESFASAGYLASRYSLTFIASYDVLGNYYKGKPVYLYRIDPR